MSHLRVVTTVAAVVWVVNCMAAPIDHEIEMVCGAAVCEPDGKCGLVNCHASFSIESFDFSTISETLSGTFTVGGPSSPAETAQPTPAAATAVPELEGLYQSALGWIEQLRADIDPKLIRVGPFDEREVLGMRGISFTVIATSRLMRQVEGYWDRFDVTMARSDSGQLSVIVDRYEASKRAIFAGDAPSALFDVVSVEDGERTRREELIADSLKRQALEVASSP